MGAEGKKPFHQSVIRAIEKAGTASGLCLLADLIRSTVLPANQLEIAEALRAARSVRGQAGIMAMSLHKSPAISKFIDEVIAELTQEAEQFKAPAEESVVPVQQMGFPSGDARLDGTGGGQLPGVQASASVSAVPDDELHAHYDHSHGVPATPEDRERTHVPVCPIRGNDNNDHGE